MHTHKITLMRMNRQPLTDTRMKMMYIGMLAYTLSSYFNTTAQPMLVARKSKTESTTVT